MINMDRIPALPSLRQLTRELKDLHEAWSHPEAGGEYAKLVCEVGGGWRVVAAGSVDDLWIAYADLSEEKSLMAYGWEYVPGSIAQVCNSCDLSPEGVACPLCDGSGNVQVASVFDATAAARRLLAAARDGLGKP